MNTADFDNTMLYIILYYTIIFYDLLKEENYKEQKRKHKNVDVVFIILPSVIHTS
jgi:hypothetical protein